MKYRPDHGQQEQSLDFGEYLDGLFGYAMVLSHNRTDAEDLVQETCLRAIRAIGRLRAQSNVKGWLFTILRNVWLNQLRRTPPWLFGLGTERDGAGDPPDTAQDPHAIYASRAEQQRVLAAIEQLPIAFREVIILREYEEFSYNEIAKLLNCPPGTVMSRLARARSRLRALLSDSVAAATGQLNEVSAGDERAA
jgi:RNA polymerase sigma-70 factor, ECF subfamily